MDNKEKKQYRPDKDSAYEKIIGTASTEINTSKSENSFELEYEKRQNKKILPYSYVVLLVDTIITNDVVDENGQLNESIITIPAGQIGVAHGGYEETVSQHYEVEFIDFTLFNSFIEQAPSLKKLNNLKNLVPG